MEKIYKLTTGKFKNGQAGMTGLETAIILIAFVTVAAVFGYAVLSAGLFSAERAKETHYSALAESKSNLELSGYMVAKSTDGINIGTLIFSLKNAIAGTPVNLTPCDGTISPENRCVVSIITPNSYVSNIKWSAISMGDQDGDNLLEPGEQFEITIDLNDLGAGNALSENITANSQITIQVKPDVGSTLSIQRTIPPNVCEAMDLY